MGLTVAVTGPTGELGISVMEALERDDRVETILAMARRSFDPKASRWRKTSYRRGDILDRAAVDSLVRDADVVVHLAFVVVGSHRDSGRVNVAGCRTVFEATVAAPRPSRLVYTSSVAAYGYHRGTPTPITESTPVTGSHEHYYSAQKAESEQVLAEVSAGTSLEAYVLRPCIVAGPKATLIVRNLPWRRLAALPGGGLLRPILPDPGIRLQLVHHDDVARAVLAAVMGTGPAGAYNLAGSGTVTSADYLRAVGALPLRVPHATVSVGSWLLAAAPLVPARAEWLHALRVPMIMDITKAREDLGWVPEHSAAETLAATVA
jgi:UDP-glucose 4-epimerase